MRGSLVRGFALGAQALERGRLVATREQRTGVVVHEARRELGGRRQEPHDHTVSAERAPVVGVEHGAAATRDHERGGRCGGIGHGQALTPSEAGLPFGGPDVVEGHTRGRDDELVGVEEGTVEELGAPLADGGLARAHQADEHEMGRSHRSVVAQPSRKDARYAA